MPHMSNLPWLTIYILTALSLLMIHTKTSWTNSLTPQNSAENKENQQMQNIWQW